MLTIAVHNAHRRVLSADLATAGPLVDEVGGPADRIWPVADSLPIRIDRPLALGSAGAHGPASYRVVGYQPGRWLRLEFTAPRCMIGFHEFSVHPNPGGGTLFQHLLAVRLRPFGWLLYPIGLKALHDQVIEKLLDRAELATTGHIRGKPVRFSIAVKLQLAMMRIYPRTHIAG